MARFLALLIPIVVLFGIAACGGGESHEDLARESVSTFKEFGNTLERVTDKASAEGHVKELDELVTKIDDLQARMEKLGTPLDSKEAEAMTKNLESEMGEAMAKISRELARIAQNPELSAVIGPVLERMDDPR